MVVEKLNDGRNYETRLKLTELRMTILVNLTKLKLKYPYVVNCF